MGPNDGDRHGFRVAIIGAGMGGLCAIQKFTEYGIDCVAFEKADEVGGTWRDNIYPGLFVDIPISLYQLQFAAKNDWSRAYAPGSEIQEYLLDTSHRHHLRDKIVFGSEITDIRWSDGCWNLQSATGQSITADAVVSATGFLHVPRLPKIANMNVFEGLSFHSSQWPEGLDVTGMKVAVVGSGSSGIQIVSALSEMDCRVDQYVRTPQWIETLDNPESSALERAVGRLSSRLGKYITERLVGRNNQDPRLRDPRWKLYPGEQRNEAVRAFHDQLMLIEDPELRAALTPDFPPGCKRIPKSPHYFEAVQRPNVTVIRRGVEELNAEGVVDADGSVEPYDVIVYASGYDAHAYMRPARVAGVDGSLLDNVWGTAPFAYRGISIPNFPNLFVLNGPFSPVNNVTVPKTLEDELQYIVHVLQRSIETGHAYAPSSSATERFVDLMKRELPRTVWWEGCDSWYQAGGDVPLLWPWLDKEQEAMFADLAPADLQAFESARSSAGSIPGKVAPSTEATDSTVGNL